MLIGKVLYITELDVDMSQVPGSAEERNEIQARIYREVVEACFESGVCQQIWFWDVYDKYSWLDEERGGDPKADPTMFNDFLQPKPAYYAVFDTLQNKISP
jgi:endo-1,4-beta-xylanase